MILMTNYWQTNTKFWLKKKIDYVHASTLIIKEKISEAKK